MRRTLFLFAGILAVPSFSWAEEAKSPAKEEPTSVKVEIRAKLRVTGKLRTLPDLEAPAKPGSPASYSVDEGSIATGATLETEQLGVVEVYFGGDTRLQELAEKLNGKTVLVSGHLDRITYYSWKHLVLGEMAICKAYNKERLLMPSWVTKTFVRASRIEPAPVP